MATPDPTLKITSPTPVTAQNSDAVNHTVKILNGESLSNAADLRLGRLARISMPASWTTADLTFQVSKDGETYQNLFDYLDVEATAQVAASREVTVDIQPFLSVRFIKVRSGTSSVAVNQGAEREITLVCLK